MASKSLALKAFSDPKNTSQMWCPVPSPTQSLHLANGSFQGGNLELKQYLRCSPGLQKLDKLWTDSHIILIAFIYLFIFGNSMTTRTYIQ